MDLTPKLTSRYLLSVLSHFCGRSLALLGMIPASVLFQFLAGQSLECFHVFGRCFRNHILRQ